MHRRRGAALTELPPCRQAGRQGRAISRLGWQPSRGGIGTQRSQHHQSKSAKAVGDSSRDYCASAATWRSSLSRQRREAVVVRHQPPREEAPPNSDPAAFGESCVRSVPAEGLKQPDGRDGLGCQRALPVSSLHTLAPSCSLWELRESTRRCPRRRPDEMRGLPAEATKLRNSTRG
jgi:hypothetical protein